jgi:transposase
MPRTVQPRRTNRYTPEFKSKAVQLSLVKGVEVQEVAKTLDIHPFMLSRWRKEYREGKVRVDGRSRPISLAKEAGEARRSQALAREVVRLRMENSLLKKWQRFLGGRRQSAIRSSRATGKSSA